MLQNLERSRAAVRSSISKASTILHGEHQLTLMEDDFLIIQQKMDKIDQKLTDLYGNWQAEYRNADTSKECDEFKRFYKPYLEKYESKYRILYQMLQQPNRQMGQVGLLSIQDPTSKTTPSLAALDDAQTLRRKEWKRGEPGEDIPRQYSTISGHLTPKQPRYEDMRMESTLNVTPAGSLNDIPAAVGGAEDSRREQETQQTPEKEVRNVHPSTTVVDSTEETSNTFVKTVLEIDSSKHGFN